jgi:3-oxoacyl-[acyl-carrier protein] reductase
MLGFTKSLAREVGSRNITVNCIAPGFIETDMTQSLDEKQRAILVDQIPVGRLGKSEDIANAVKFLALPESNYVSGITLHVNGGMYMD